MSALPATIRPRIAQFVRLLGSTHDGEVVAAARATERTLRAAGASLSDLAEVIEREPAPRVVYRDRPDERCPHVSPAWGNSAPMIVRAKLERAIKAGVLSAWEQDFAASIAGQIAASRFWRPTTKQEQRLDALMAKLEAAGAWA